ncbi:MAG: tetratricopeptide repeat protein [Candidatus Cloacimonadales bacterium]
MKIGLKKSNKTAFGIFQDGLRYQLVELELANGNFSIKNLDKIVLSSPFFEEAAGSSQSLEIGADGELNISNFEDMTSSDLEAEYTPKASGYEELRDFLKKYDLDQGTISFTCEDESVAYFHFTSEFFKKPFRSKLKKELLSKEEIKAKNYQLVYHLNADKSGLAIVHRGNFEILDTLKKLNPILSKDKFFYAEIQSNEIALTEIVRNCYQFPEDEYVTVVYIGSEYKKGIVLRNNQYLKSFAIIAPIADPQTMRNTIYSKLILEQDNSDIPITENLLFAGKFSTDEDIAFYRDKIASDGVIEKIAIPEIFSLTEPELAETEQTETEVAAAADTEPTETVEKTTSEELEELDLSQYGLEEYDVEAGNLEETESSAPAEDWQAEKQVEAKEFTAEDLAEYAIPISLAWKALKPKKNSLNLNLLPSKIAESQKYFKISWHGFLIMAAIFYFAFSGTMRKLELNQDVLLYHRRNYRVENELSSNRTLVAKLNNLKAELSQIESNMEKVTSVVGDRNQWSYIIKTLSETLQANPLSWLTSITADSNEISVDGMTTQKRNIILFANLFPNGQIISISKATILENTLWNFSLNYSYPDKSLTDKYFIESIPIPQKAVTKEDFKVNERELYQDILSEYLQGNYQAAVTRFSEYIQAYPDYPLAYNAHYNLGESYYMLGNYSAALAKFKYILEQGGNKVPDALMMSGNVFVQTNQIDKAVAAYRELIETYPKHDLSKIARYKLTQDKLKR